MPETIPQILFQQPLAEIPYGIPYRKEAHKKHRDEDYYHIHSLYADRIGIDHKASGTAQTNQPERLLNPAEQQARHHPDKSPEKRNHPPLEQEYAHNLVIIRTQITQSHHVFALVDDEHRERTDDIETGYH